MKDSAFLIAAVKAVPLKPPVFPRSRAVLSKDESTVELRNLTHLLMYIALIEKNFNQSHKKLHY